MSVVVEIIRELGGPTKIGAALPAPVQTVHYWSKRGVIPHWRRPSILELARRLGKALSPAAIVYLVSGELPAPQDVETQPAAQD